MNKTDLIANIAAETELSKVAVASVLDKFIETVQTTVGGGEEVVLVGFGTFKASDRAARTGKNPRTGETLKIEATTVPSFKPGAKFKEIVAKAKK